jgi:hypothetical protein
MIQIFVKDFNLNTFVLELEDNYTISSKELFVKSLKLIFKKQNKTLEEVINNNNNFISIIYCKISNKFFRFDNKNIYFNTNKLKDQTIIFNILAGYNKMTSELEKEEIFDIINGYY